MKVIQPFALAIIFSSTAFAQNVGINTDGSNPTMMLDVKTSPSAISDGIRINNPNTGDGDAILNFQNNGTDVWTFGFDDSDADKLKIANGSNLTTNPHFTMETDGDVGLGITAPMANFHVVGDPTLGTIMVAPSETTSGDNSRVFFAEDHDGTYGMFFEYDGASNLLNLSGYSTGSVLGPHLSVNRDNGDARFLTGDVYVDAGYVSVGATTTSITKHGVFEMNWDESFNFNSSSDQYRTLGLFNAFSRHGTNITITDLEWSVDAFHQDGNEDPIALYVTLNTDNSNNAGTMGWKGWYGNGISGARDIQWNYVDNDMSITVGQDMYIKLRARDQDIAFDGDDRFYINNLTLKIKYTYTQALQVGDIAASGEVYGRNIYSLNTTGDVAERFEISPETPNGFIVAQVPGKDNQYQLADGSSLPYLIGVVSPNPSVVLNEAGYGAKIGLIGRVDVQIDPASPKIQAGDPVTVSPNEPGKGFLASEMVQIIGRATTNQKEGENFVQIYLTPGAIHIPQMTSSKEDGAGLEELRGIEKKSSEKGMRKADD